MKQILFSLIVFVSPAAFSQYSTGSRDYYHQESRSYHSRHEHRSMRDVADYWNREFAKAEHASQGPEYRSPTPVFTFRPQPLGDTDADKAYKSTRGFVLYRVVLVPINEGFGKGLVWGSRLITGSIDAWNLLGLAVRIHPAASMLIEASRPSLMGLAYPTPDAVAAARNYLYFANQPIPLWHSPQWPSMETFERDASHSEPLDRQEVERIERFSRFRDTG